MAKAENGGGGAGSGSGSKSYELEAASLPASEIGEKFVVDVAAGVREYDSDVASGCGGTIGVVAGIPEETNFEIKVFTSIMLTKY